MALAYLHGQKMPIIRQDFKPQNIFVDKSYHAKICDFGLSPLRDAHAIIISMSIAMGLTRTVTYMAPEVLLNNKVP